MKKITHTFSFDCAGGAEELTSADRLLLQEAQSITRHAYAPYSRFHVGAALVLSNGQIVRGTNQENASFPAGICAERVALASAATQFPDVAVSALAVSYDNKQGSSTHPITPCGICRQTLLEQEQKQQMPIRLILGGLSGKIFILASAKYLLPMSFSASDMAEEP